jgi:hypothetical protein
MAKDDDSSVRLIRTSKPEYVLKSRDTGMIAKHLYIHRRAITLAQTRSKFHLGVPGIIVPDESPNKPHHDHFPRAIDSAIDDLLGTQAQRRYATRGEENRKHFSHVSSMGVPANLCQAARS